MNRALYTILEVLQKHDPKREGMTGRAIAIAAPGWAVNRLNVYGHLETLIEGGLVREWVEGEHWYLHAITDKGDRARREAAPAPRRPPGRLVPA